MQKTRLAILAPAAVGAIIAVFITSGALAGKAGGGGTPSPTHTLINLGRGTYGHYAVNESGMVVGTLGLPGNLERGFIVVPEDTNGNGRPDTWFRDVNGDGYDDLLVDLGRPAPYAGLGPKNMRLFASDINDAGQVVGYFGIVGTNFSDSAGFIITPLDVNQDGRLEWFYPDATGANALMTRIDLWDPDAAVPPVISGLSINNAGQIAGIYNVGGVQRGFLVDPVDADGDGVADAWFQDDNGDGINDLYVDLGAGRNTRGILVPLVPADINDAGQVVGAPSVLNLASPFLLTPKRDPSTGRQIWNQDANGDGVNDRVTMLPVLSKGYAADANAINAAGVVAGSAATKQGGYAVLWRVDAQGKATITNLGVKGTGATGINASQQVVGNWNSSTVFLWQNGVMSDLRNLVQPGALLGSYMTADAINDLGMIVGRNNTSPSTGYIAVPNSLLP